MKLINFSQCTLFRNNFHNLISHNRLILTIGKYRPRLSYSSWNHSQTSPPLKRTMHSLPLKAQKKTSKQTTSKLRPPHTATLFLIFALTPTKKNHIRCSTAIRTVHSSRSWRTNSLLLLIVRIFLADVVLFSRFSSLPDGHRLPASFAHSNTLNRARLGHLRRRRSTQAPILLPSTLTSNATQCCLQRSRINWRLQIAFIQLFLGDWMCMCEGKGVRKIKW